VAITAQKGSTSASARILRSYSIILGLVAISLVTLGCILLVLQNRQPTRDADEAFSAAAVANAALISARMISAEQQLKRSRDAMEDLLADPLVNLSNTRHKFVQVTNAARGRKPVGSYLSIPTRDPDRIIEIIGDERLALRASTSELEAAMLIARGFPADRSSNPLLFRSSYISARNRFLAVETPSRFAIADDFARRWKNDPSLTGTKIFDELDALHAPLFAPAIKAKVRATTWTEPYLSYGLTQPQIALMVPVYRNALPVGTMSKHFLIGELLQLPAQRQLARPVAAYVVTADGQLITLSFDTRKLASLVAPPANVAKLLAKTKANESMLLSDASTRAVLVPISGTPWRLLAVGERPSLIIQAITLSKATTITLLAFLSVCAFAFYAFRQTFLKPAVLLLQRARLTGPTTAPPPIAKLWQPWLDLIENGRRQTTEHVQALEEQNQWRSAILGSAIDGVVTSDEAGVITDFNPAAEAMFGWARADIIGKTMEETIVPPNHRAAHHAGMARYTASGEARTIRRQIHLHGLRRDGSIFPLELAIAEATIGESRIFIGYIRNLTAQHESEAELLQSREALHQSEKLASLGSLLAGVAHELNNPLAIVVGRAAILEEKLAGSPLLPPLQKLRAAADRCGRIVKTFLAMARQSGPRRSRVQLNDLVAGALDMSAYGLRTDGVEVRLDLYPALPSTSADSDQLVQVLINLIINAQQAMAAMPGSHRLTVRTRHAQRQNAVILEVEDSGPGVPADLVTRIFDPFFTTKEVGAGTGMGLSVSKGMIEAQGGTLTLVKKASVGAIFRITLPIRDLEPDDREIAVDSGTERARGRILIVDDEVELAELLAECLTPLGVSCDIASDGIAALDRLALGNYDAIFTDVRMPLMDGVTLYEQVQAQYPGLAKRLAFVSGDVLHNDAARITAIGDRPVIEKPFDPQIVRDVALRLLATGQDA
jgi:PAS domain S-box-containing protein